MYQHHGNPLHNTYHLSTGESLSEQHIVLVLCNGKVAKMCVCLLLVNAWAKLYTQINFAIYDCSSLLAIN